MKMIPISQIVPGMVTEAEYFTKDGDLLLARNITIDQSHLQTLQRRKVTELYLKAGSDEDELSQILSTDFKSFDELTFEDSKHSTPPPALDIISTPVKTSLPPELKSIKAGQDGLAQLNESKKALDLDRKMSETKTSDRPTGPALKDRIKEMKVEERTESYKTQMTSSYSDALANVKFILNSVVEGKTVDGSIVKGIVDGFINTFVTDRNILLNISNTKHTGDDYLYHHSLNVCLISLNIAASSGYSEDQVREIGMGALLHDVGMMLIPKRIRTKNGKLDQDEWFEIQKHPILGLHLLEKISRLPDTVPYVAYQCHERENAKGYPKQRSGRFLHCFAKIVQLADVYEALSSPRNYREAYVPYKAMELIIKMTRSGLISGEFTKAFLDYTSLFPVGSIVELSDHRIGKVVVANKKAYAKPQISIIVDEKGSLLAKDKIYQEDLAVNANIQIAKAHPYNFIQNVDLMHGF